LNSRNYIVAVAVVIVVTVILIVVVFGEAPTSEGC
jgi:hypothetical protein